MGACCEELTPVEAVEAVEPAPLPALRLVPSEAPAAGADIEVEAAPEPAGAHHTALKWVRLAFSLGLLGAAAWFLIARSPEIASALRSTSRLDARWVLVAVGFEVASMVAFGRVQQKLLALGGSKVPLRTMVSLVLGANALSSTLPGGVAWSTAWEFGQLDRWGVKRSVRLWVFLVAGAVSGFALFLVAAVGTEVAGSKGPVADLRLVAAGLAVLPGLAWVIGKLWPATTRRPRELWGRLGAIHISARDWTGLLGLGVANWVLDGAVLAVSMLAIGVAVPWPDILVIYGLTQVTASLPITPGGLGLVEGSLAALLMAYGVGTEPALATVIVYRLISFWGFMPLGWAAWLGVNLSQHRLSSVPVRRRTVPVPAPALRPAPLALYQPATPPAA